MCVSLTLFPPSQSTAANLNTSFKRSVDPERFLYITQEHNEPLQWRVTVREKGRWSQSEGRAQLNRPVLTLINQALNDVEFAAANGCATDISIEEVLCKSSDEM